MLFGRQQMLKLLFHDFLNQLYFMPTSVDYPSLHMGMHKVFVNDSKL